MKTTSFSGATTQGDLGDRTDRLRLDRHALNRPIRVSFGFWVQRRVSSRRWGDRRGLLGARDHGVGRGAHSWTVGVRVVISRGGRLRLKARAVLGRGFLVGGGFLRILTAELAGL